MKILNILLIALCLYSSRVLAAPDFSEIISELEQHCSDVYPDTLQSHKNNGELSMESGTRVNDDDDLLTFKKAKDIANNTCGAGIKCGVNGEKSKALNLVSIRANNGSNTKIEVSEGGNRTIGTGTIRFDEIVVKKNGTLNFTLRENEVYEINKLVVEEGATVVFTPGQYAVYETEFKKESNLTINGADVVYFFTQKELKLEGSLNTPASELFFIVNNKATIKLETSNEIVHTSIYAKNDMEISGKGELNGAFSGKHIRVKEEITINYEQVCEEIIRECSDAVPGWESFPVHEGDFVLAESALQQGSLYVKGDVLLKSKSTFQGNIYAEGDIVIESGEFPFFTTIVGNVGTEGCLNQENNGTDITITGNVCSASDCSSPSNYMFTFDGTQSTALTCEPHVVKIQVKLDDQVDTTYNKLVNLSTSTNLGDWSVMPSNKGVLNNAGAGDATYKFENEDNGQIELGLWHTQSGPVTVEVSNADATATYDINFATAAIKAEFSCRNSIDENCINIANHPFALTLTAMKENDATQLCESYDPASIDFWSDYINPATASNRAVSVTKGVSTTEVGKSILTATALDIAFSGGVATLSANYPDAGKIKLNVRDTNQQSIVGGAEVVLNPHQLVVDSVTEKVRNIQGNRTSDVDGFIRASVADYADLKVDTFDARVLAVMDCTSTGVSANCGTNHIDNITPSFANDVELTNSFVSPTGGALGNLQYNNSDPDASLFVVPMQAGDLTYYDLAYDEVGSIELRANSKKYLNITDNNITLSVAKEVGRFYPDYLAYGSFTAVPANGGSGGFTYMDQQQIKVSYVLQALAQSSDLKVTTNYDHSLGYPVATNFSVAVENKQEASLTARLLSDTAYLPIVWEDGGYQLEAGNEYNVGLARPALLSGRATPDGPYFNDPAINNGDLVNYYLSVVGIDGEQLAPIDSAQTCKSLSSFCQLGDLGDIAYGRLIAGNGHGSEFQPIRTLIEATYFDGAQFVTFERDNFMPVINAQLSASPTMSNNEVVVGSGKTKLSILNSPLISGKSYFEFSAPNDRGSLDYYIKLKDSFNGSLYTPWLLDSENTVTCPTVGGLNECISGHVAFGLFRGNDRIIYRMQTFE